jgi:hypothetical protein
MHCIQGSDAHRLVSDHSRKGNLGVGERPTDVLIPEVSFNSLKELFSHNDFSKTRPHRHKAEPAFDFIQTAREEGSNIVQDFHESVSVRGGRLYSVIADISAFANTNGGTLFLGLNADPKKEIAGVTKPDQAIAQLEKEIGNRISPHLHCTFDSHETGGKTILRVLVPRGEDPPYVVDDYKIYVRAESETSQAVRDEIVSLVRRGKSDSQAIYSKDATTQAKEPVETPQVSTDLDKVMAPRTGVEVVGVEERDGGSFYTVRDLRNGNVVKNVTLKSARKLWHYALTQYASLPEDLKKAEIEWLGDYGLLRKRKQGKRLNYDLVERAAPGNRYYFGVTDDGIHGPWKQLVGQEEE